MENASDGHVSELNIEEEGISELEDISIDTSKDEKQGEKKTENRTDCPRTVGIYTSVTCDRNARTERISETVMTESFLK